MDSLKIAVIPGDGIGYPMMHDTLMEAIETVLRDGKNLTRDMGGNAGTHELGQALVEAITQ